MSFVGVDIGQTGAKVLAFDTSGRPLASAYREYDILSARPGWAYGALIAMLLGGLGVLAILLRRVLRKPNVTHESP